MSRSRALRLSIGVCALSLMWFGLGSVVSAGVTRVRVDLSGGSQAGGMGLESVVHLPGPAGSSQTISVEPLSARGSVDGHLPADPGESLQFSLFGSTGSMPSGQLSVGSLSEPAWVQFWEDVDGGNSSARGTTLYGFNTPILDAPSLGPSSTFIPLPPAGLAGFATLMGLAVVGLIRRVRRRSLGISDRT